MVKRAISLRRRGQDLSSEGRRGRLDSDQKGLPYFELLNTVTSVQTIIFHFPALRRHILSHPQSVCAGSLSYSVMSLRHASLLTRRPCQSSRDSRYGRLTCRPCDGLFDHKRRLAAWTNAGEMLRGWLANSMRRQILPPEGFSTSLCVNGLDLGSSTWLVIWNPSRQIFSLRQSRASATP